MTKTKVLVVDSDLEGRSSLAIQALKEKFGDDVVIVTPKEAIEQGIVLDEFANIPRMKITAPPMGVVPMLIGGTPPTGQERRRSRRKQERSKSRK